MRSLDLDCVECVKTGKGCTFPAGDLKTFFTWTWYHLAANFKKPTRLKDRDNSNNSLTLHPTIILLENTLQYVSLAGRFVLSDKSFTQRLYACFDNIIEALARRLVAIC